MSHYKIKSFLELMKLERTDTLFSLNIKWPSEEIKKNWEPFTLWDDAIDYIKKTFQTDDVVLSGLALLNLQKNLDQFLGNPESLHKILRLNKRFFPSVIGNFHNLMVNSKPLDDESNIDSLIKFINNIPKEKYPQIIVPLIKYHLNAIASEFIRDFIEDVYYKTKNEPAIKEINDINIFLTKRILKDELKALEARDYDEALNKIGVPSIYRNTTYFMGSFFDWFFSLNNYSYDLLEANNDRIKNLTHDEKILLEAKIIETKYKSSNIEEYENEIRRIDDSFFTSQLDKTEEGFWKISDINYNDDRNKELLKEAHRIYEAIFTRLIITTFFDKIGEAALDFKGQSRAEFWRRYGNSEKLEEVKLVLNQEKKDRVYSGLSITEKRIFNKHLIFNKSNTKSQCPVFIMRFDKIMIIEFVGNSNACQYLSSTDPRITNLLNSKEVYDYAIFKILPVYAISTYNQGRLIHRGNAWRGKIEEILDYHNISLGIN